MRTTRTPLTHSEEQVTLPKGFAVVDSLSGSIAETTRTYLSAVALADHRSAVTLRPHHVRAL